VREAEDKPWLLQVTDYISVNEIIETRNREEDDLLFHKERINAINSSLVKASDAVQKVFGDHEAAESLVQIIGNARSLTAHGEFDLAKKACSEALEKFQKADRILLVSDRTV